jgi:hypothetical protein
MVYGTEGTYMSRELGYRAMAVYQGESDPEPALYVSTWSRSLGEGLQILRTVDGENFERVGPPGIVRLPVTSTRSLVPFFEQNLPHGGSVYVCDTTDTAFRMLARDGHLPVNIVPSFDIARASYAIVHHEHHFIDVDVQIWSAYGSVKPVYVLTYDGVPIISVYKNPRR